MKLWIFGCCGEDLYPGFVSDPFRAGGRDTERHRVASIQRRQNDRLVRFVSSGKVRRTRV